MNILDVVIVVVMAFLVVRGVMRGFFGEVASLAGIIFGIWLAVHYMTRVTEYLRPHLPHLAFLPVLSFASIFIGVLILCNLAGWGLRILFKKTALGWVDRTLGAGLAVIKGVVVAYLAIVILTVYLPPATPLIAQSKLAPVVTASFQAMKRAVSPRLFQEWTRRFRKTGPEEKTETPKAPEQETTAPDTKNHG
jgi:membrane protein required for colicin V production